MNQTAPTEINVSDSTRLMVTNYLKTLETVNLVLQSIKATICNENGVMNSADYYFSQDCTKIIYVPKQPPEGAQVEEMTAE